MGVTGLKSLLTDTPVRDRLASSHPCNNVVVTLSCTRPGPTQAPGCFCRLQVVDCPPNSRTVNSICSHRLIILVQDASLTWTTPVELTAANCPPLVLDAAGFKMMVCQSEQVLSGAARLWRLDGG